MLAEHGPTKGGRRETGDGGAGCETWQGMGGWYGVSMTRESSMFPICR